MAERNVGAAVVIDPEGQGPASHRARHPRSRSARARTPTSERVADHLTADLVFAAPDWSLEQAAVAMVRGGFRHLSWSRAARSPAILSVRDIVRCWTDDGAICDVPAHRDRRGALARLADTSARRRPGRRRCPCRAWRRSARPAPGAAAAGQRRARSRRSMPSVAITSTSPRRQRASSRRGSLRQPVAERRRRTRARPPRGGRRGRVGAHAAAPRRCRRPAQDSRAARRGRTRRAVMTTPRRVHAAPRGSASSSSCGPSSACAWTTRAAAARRRRRPRRRGRARRSSATSAPSRSPHEHREVARALLARHRRARRCRARAPGARRGARTCATT